MKDQSLHFFTGENSYALTQELLRWKASFSEKHGSENLETFSGKNVTFSDLMNAVSSLPFIGGKRLIILEGIPKMDRDQWAHIPEAIHPDCLLLIVDPKPDKRLGLTKDIEKSAAVRTFPLLSRAELLAWMKRKVEQEGLWVSDSDLGYLVEIVGEDQWMLSQELGKLIAHAAEKVTREAIEALAVPSGNQVVWRLTDLLGKKDIPGALQFFHHRVERGEDPYGLWVILMNMVRNLISIVESLDAGLKSEKEIASCAGIHFFAVRGLLPLARSLSRDQRSTLLKFVVEADIALKTGGHHYTSEEPRELLAIVERTMILCR